jgi:prepilin-type N-terminal cleavage/methylation domain-containing protein
MFESAIKRVRQRVQNDEAGFTLIELLVVVIIIGILAAIAIPTFLNQRKKGWESAVKSDLRNYAIVMETHLTETGSYAAVGPPVLTDPVKSAGVTITNVATTDPTKDYCIEGYHANNSDDKWRLRPGAGGMEKKLCSAT